MEVTESKVFPKLLSYNKSIKTNTENINSSNDLCSKIGLSKNQFKILRHLNTNGLKTASQLAKNLDIPRTEVYALLKILQEKDCIIPKNDKPLKFKALSIEEILNKKIDFEQKKLQELEEILRLIKS